MGKEKRCTWLFFSDSQEALKALKAPAQQSGQFLICNITALAATINKSGFASVHYQWCPGHSKILGNEEAHVKESHSLDTPRCWWCIAREQTVFISTQNADNGGKSEESSSENWENSALAGKTEQKKDGLQSC